MSDEIVERPVKAVAEQMLTIILTGRRPITVKDADWPYIANGEAAWHDGQYYSQASRKLLCEIDVRQHADGRCIIYGEYDFESQFRGESDVRCFAGTLAPEGMQAIVEQIDFVADNLIKQVRDSNYHHYIRLCASRCVCNLPPETIE